MKTAARPLLLLGFLILAFGARAADEFPGREIFPLIPVIELADLYKNFDKYTVVDARSAYEYDTLRIKGAYNVPVASADFDKRVQELVAKHKKPIAFYCNGKTCYKSYKATLRARSNGVKDCVAFDAGIFDWVKAHPELGELLGQSPVNPAHLIGGGELKAHMLAPGEFAKSASAKGAIVLDVRDPFQRDGIGFFPDVEKLVPLDRTEELNKYIQLAKAQKRPLLIYDEAGKQVRWLQYRLERAGLKDYHFMQHGAKGFYDALILSSGYRYKAHH